MILLLSTYDLGRQPFGLASPAAWLRQAGFTVQTRDLSRDALDEAEACGASVIAFYLPMHTATRLALPVIDRVRALNPSATVAAYGLYAPLNAELLRERGVSVVLGPEAEADLVSLSSGQAIQSSIRRTPRLSFITPDRSTLPPPSKYAALQMPDGSRRIAGATDATRGCKHRCRHCPIVPIYEGQFRVVPLDVVLADIDQQVAAGAQHISFGDPDFFNGPTHARRIVEALHDRHQSLTYDVTIKIEHLLKHRELLRVLARTGCAFVTSAVEAVNDEILIKLEKGHTRADFLTATALCRAEGLALSPTFVAFTPWTTLDGYRDLLDAVAALDLVEHVSPVQWGLRLLITQGSRLLELEEIRARVQSFDRATLTYLWSHDDPRVDVLQKAIMQMVGVRTTRSRTEIFDRVRGLAEADRAAHASVASVSVPRAARSTVPYLDEPWYC